MKHFNQKKTLINLFIILIQRKRTSQSSVVNVFCLNCVGNIILEYLLYTDFILFVRLGISLSLSHSLLFLRDFCWFQGVINVRLDFESMGFLSVFMQIFFQYLLNPLDCGFSFNTPYTVNSQWGNKKTQTNQWFFYGINVCNEMLVYPSCTFLSVANN